MQLLAKREQRERERERVRMRERGRRGIGEGGKLDQLWLLWKTAKTRLTAATWLSDAAMRFLREATMSTLINSCIVWCVKSDEYGLRSINRKEE
jgi:hypothetical protein